MTPNPIPIGQGSGSGPGPGPGPGPGSGSGSGSGSGPGSGPGPGSGSGSGPGPGSGSGSGSGPGPSTPTGGVSASAARGDDLSITQAEKDSNPEFYNDELSEVFDKLIGIGQQARVRELRKKISEMIEQKKKMKDGESLITEAKVLMKHFEFYDNDIDYTNEIKNVLFDEAKAADDKQREVFNKLKNLYDTAVKVRRTDMNYFTSTYRSVFKEKDVANTGEKPENYDPYFAIEYLYETVEKNQIAMKHRYNLLDSERVKLSAYDENSFAIFPYKERLGDLLHPYCTRNDLINWKSTIESEYKLHRNNKNMMEKRLEAFPIIDYNTEMKRNIGTKQINEFILTSATSLERQILKFGGLPRVTQLRHVLELFKLGEIIAQGKTKEDVQQSMTEIQAIQPQAKRSLGQRVADVGYHVGRNLYNQEGTAVHSIGKKLSLNAKRTTKRDDTAAAGTVIGGFTRKKKRKKNRTQSKS